jgi:hypothetical protein
MKLKNKSDEISVLECKLGGRSSELIPGYVTNGEEVWLRTTVGSFTLETSRSKHRVSGKTTLSGTITTVSEKAQEMLGLEVGSEVKVKIWDASPLRGPAVVNPRIEISEK